MTQVAQPVAEAPPATRRLPAWGVLAAPSVVPALLMLTVGGIGLRRPALGWDENATWLASQRSPGQIVELARHVDGVIAPYYLFMHFWTAVFGDSEFWLRAPSLVAVAAGVGVAGELGRRLFSPGVGLFAGVLLVAVPQLSRYAQNARVYGFAFLFATLATLLLYRAVERPSRDRWIAYGIVVALTGLAHILALLVLVGHGYVAVRRGAWPRWLVTAAAALIPVLPLVLLGLRQRTTQLEWITAMSPGVAAAAPGAVFGSAAAGLLLIGVAFVVRWPDRPLVAELAVLAAAPPILLIAVSFVTSSLWVPRYVLMVLPPIALLAAAALAGMRLRAVAVLLLLALVAAPAQRQVRGPASHMGPDFRTVAGVIAAQRQPGDVIVYGTEGTWSLRAGIDYQLRGRPKPRDALLLRPAADVGELNAVQCARPVVCLGPAKRVWFFRQWASGAPLSNAGALTTTLRDNYRQARVWHATKATLVLFERR